MDWYTVFRYILWSLLVRRQGLAIAGRVQMTPTQCCQNGGTCMLGSFCACLPDYYGRYCEYLLLKRSCGSLKHGTWVRYQCDLCWCFDGTLQCEQRVFHSCRDRWPKKHVVTVNDLLSSGKDIYVYPRDDDVSTAESLFKCLNKTTLTTFILCTVCYFLFSIS